MDAELVALASAAGSTVVGLLATDVWGAAKSAMGALWGKVHPDRANIIEADLVESRDVLLAAQLAGDTSVEPRLVGEWQGRLERLLAADPEIAAELQKLLDGELARATQRAQLAPSPDVTMRAKATGHARIYQSGRDMHIER